MKDLIIHPVQFFERTKEKEVNIAIPLVILFLVGIVDGVVNSLVAEHISMSDLVNGSFPLFKFISLVVTSNLSFYIIIALQTLLFPLIIKKLGGTGGSRKHSFYILGLASFPLLIQSVIHVLFPGTVWWQYFEHMSVLYLLSYSLFNAFNIWSVALLIIGFAKVYNVSYKTASILYVQFLVKLIPVIIITLLAS